MTYRYCARSNAAKLVCPTRPAHSGGSSASLIANLRRLIVLPFTMGKKGKKAQAGKPKKLTPKDVGKRMDVLVKKVEEELKGADLFAPLPPTEDCAICLVPLSPIKSETRYQTCCGNVICVGCHRENAESIKKQNEENTGKKVAFSCPFCREPEPTVGQGYVCQLQARCLQNDHNAFMMMGNIYMRGEYEDVARDDLKALDCLIQAVELGSAAACVYIGTCYFDGKGVSVNKERAAFFERVGALRGDIVARSNIGINEMKSQSVTGRFRPKPATKTPSILSRKFIMPTAKCPARNSLARKK